MMILRIACSLMRRILRSAGESGKAELKARAFRSVEPAA
jgi:hypothetical protein